MLQVQRQSKEDSQVMAHTLTATEMGWVANEHEETWLCWTGKPTTSFLQRKPNKPCHIDYLFASADPLPACSLRVGTPADCLPLSERVPIVVTLNG